MVQQLRPVTRPRLYEVIVEQLCGYIADNEMTTGDRLPAERDLAAKLGVSRASLSQALVALEVQGDHVGVLSALGRMLALAEPQGYVRLFLDEGAAMVVLLHQAATRGVVSGYGATLLEAAGERGTVEHRAPSLYTDSLLEPLTEREREVLQLLADGASNRQIADYLVLSVHTVKKHVLNICGKLGVQSRTQALAKARSLNLY